jgi:hypothetical protein
MLQSPSPFSCGSVRIHCVYRSVGGLDPFLDYDSRSGVIMDTAAISISLSGFTAFIVQSGGWIRFLTLSCISATFFLLVDS